MVEEVHDLDSIGKLYAEKIFKIYLIYINFQTQFCIMLVYLFSLILMDSKMPKALTFFFVANVVVFLYLFADFYIKAYRRPKRMIKNNNNTQLLENDKKK